MNFNVTTNRRQSNVGSVGVGLGSSVAVGSRLSMYRTPPNDEVAIEDVEQFALDRLRVLKGVEEFKLKIKRPDEVDGAVFDLWRKHMRTASALESMRKDMVSHFVLRLAFCMTEELRRWFLTMETNIFRHRFRNETSEMQRRFLEESRLPYKAMSTSDYESVREKLAQVARSVGAPPPQDDSVYYKVQFEEVTELVATRRVYLSKGYAYIPREQLAAVVVGHFRARLSKALVLTNRKWALKIASEEKDRLVPIVQALSTRYLGPDYSQPQTAGHHIGLKDIEVAAQKSFPLCMRHLFTKLKEEHHLRHGGRMQLGLFLKGIGLTLEDALAFWRSEFGKGVGVEKFDKEYAYNVRHNYGKEGKRTDYTPHSCIKIIKQTPGVGDHHGCPYRHFGEENLRLALGSLRISMRATDEILEKVRGSHYQLACAKTFEATHGCGCDAGINHPNQYIEQSWKLLKAAEEEAAEKNKDGGAVPGRPVESESTATPMEL